MHIYTKTNDIYTLGLIVFEIFSTLIDIKENIYWRVPQKVFDFISERIKMIPDYLRELVEKCIDSDPNVRPSFSEIVDHLTSEEFLNEISNYFDINDYLNHIDYIEGDSTDDIFDVIIINKDFYPRFDKNNKSFNSYDVEYTFRKRGKDEIEEDIKIYHEIPSNLAKIDLNDFTRGPKLGKGSFGTVYGIINSKNKEKFCCKNNKI